MHLFIDFLLLSACIITSITRYQSSIALLQFYFEPDPVHLQLCFNNLLAADVYIMDPPRATKKFMKLKEEWKFLNQKQKWKRIINNNFGISGMKRWEKNGR